MMNALTSDWGKAATILGVASMVISVVKEALSEKSKSKELEERVKMLEATAAAMQQQQAAMLACTKQPAARTRTKK